MKDYYTVLGVEKNANDEQIKKAFRSLAQKYHPDKKGGDEAKFKEISEAYAVLSDKKRRAQYDQFGGAGAQGGFGGFNNAQGFGGFDFSQFQDAFRNGGFETQFDMGDIFGDLFGGGRGRARRGRDIAVDIEIDLRDAVFGTKRTMLLTKTSACTTCKGTGAKPEAGTNTCSTCSGRGQIRETRQSFLGNITTARTCPNCEGAGTVPKEVCSTCKGKGVEKKQEEVVVEIPAGIDNGEMIRQPHRGEAIKGGEAGDLYIKIHIRPHKNITRSGAHLRTTLSIKLTEALLGTQKTIETLEGTDTLTIPAGTNHTDILALSGKGVPHNGRRGDLLVTIHVETPSKLSRKAKQLVQDLANEGL